MGARSGRLTACGRIMAIEVATMNLARIPAILPAAITVSREVAELCLAEDLAVYGASGPAALAWQWALTGQGPTPVSLREWHTGPPDHDTLLDESRWPYGDGWSGRAARAEIDKALPAVVAYRRPAGGDPRQVPSCASGEAGRCRAWLRHCDTRWGIQPRPAPTAVLSAANSGADSPLGGKVTTFMAWRASR